MSISGISSQISSLQALRSFQQPNTEKTLKQVQGDGLVQGNDYNEIKNLVNKNDIDDEDIQYALKHGTSLFADYIV